MSDPMVGVNGGSGRTGSVIVPNFSIFIGSPSHVASSKARKNTPAFVAQSDVKMEVLKKQYICMSQVSPFRLSFHGRMCALEVEDSE